MESGIMDETSSDETIRVVFTLADRLYESGSIRCVRSRVCEVLALMPANDIEPVPDLVTESGGSGIDAKYIQGRLQAWVMGNC